MRSSLFLLAPAVVAAASPALFARVCGDNCARAVIASAFTTRHGSADCASYLKTTVTPATSTITETVTMSFTATNVVSVTSTTSTTATITNIVTEVDHETATETVATRTTTVPAVQQPQKRDETSHPTLIPAYASACSGAARYTTACACVGVYPTTITAATPLTTETVYQSVTSETVTITTTASTETLVLTETSTVSTTVTTTDATADVTAVATATAAPTQFYIRVADGTYQGQYFAPTVYQDTTASGYRATPQLTTSKANALIAKLEGTTLYLVDSTHEYVSFMGYSKTPGHGYAVLMMNPLGVSTYVNKNYANLVCSITGTALSCTEVADSTYNTFIRQSGNNGIYVESAADIEYSNVHNPGAYTTLNLEIEAA